MVVQVQRPAFNLREKLNEISGRVSPNRMPPGSIIQVRYNHIASSGSQGYNSSSTSYNDTGHDVLISPRFSTSKVLVSVGVQIFATNSGHHSYVGIVRDDNVSGSGHPAGVLFHASTLWEASGPGQAGNISFSYLDSPQTTSEVKYSIYIKSDNSGNTVYINGSSDSDCYIMAQEVKQ